jgi:hypothetical protein
MPTSLPQCDAFGFIYDKAGAPAADVLVTLKKVYDADGNPILISPLTTVTDSDGAYHFTLPQNALAYVSARATTLWICPPEGIPYRVPATSTGELLPAFPPPDGFIVLPPLSYVSNTLSLAQSSATVDGYLSAVDYARFDAATTDAGVTAFNGRAGAVVPVGTDYQAFYLSLTGGALSGPLVLAANPASGLQAATKQYVDAQVASATAGVSSFAGRSGIVVPVSSDYSSFYLSLNGGTLVGPLVLPGDPATPLQAATKAYVDAHAGSGSAGVSSFNTRTGAVTLTSADVTSALVYTPLNRAGDTMTGALVLSGNPLVTFGAATKNYVDISIGAIPVFSVSQPGLVPQPTAGDAAKVLTGAGTWVTPSSGATTVPGIYLVTNFKASGSAQKFTGNGSAGGNVVGTTAGTDFVVGQGIYIGGAGTAGAPLITKVTALNVAKDTITIQDAIVTTVFGQVVQHDDTVAIQTAINQVFNDGGGVLQFTPGCYRVNGPVQSSTNSILRIPYNSWTIAPRSIALVGVGADPFGAVLAPPSQFGPMIQTDVIGTNSQSSILATTLFADGTDVTSGSQLTIRLENLTFRTYDNPQISGVDLGMAWNVLLKNVLIDVGMPMESWPGPPPVTGGSQPTHGTFGLRLPRVNVCTIVHAENIYVQNYHIGVIGGELFVSVSTGIYRCNIGLQLEHCNHPTVGRFLIVQCPTGIFFNGSHVPVDYSVDFESDTTGWWASISGRYIYDPADVATGHIKYINISAASSSASVPITTTGLSKCTLFSLDTYGAQIPKAQLMGDASVSGDLGIVGDLTLNGRLVSSGTNDSAGTGFQQLRVPNGGGSPGIVTGIVSYWKMDEATGTRQDSLMLNPLPISGADLSDVGIVGSAVKGGGGTYLQGADSASLGFSGSMTIAGWLYQDVALNTLGVLYSKWGLAATRDSFLMYNGYTSPGTPGIQFGCSSDGTAQTTLSLPATLSVGTWYFIVAWYDASLHTLNLQLGSGGTLGTPVSTPFLGPIFHGTSTPCCLLYADGSLNLFTSGRVDELGIWSRVLTPVEIAALYNSGAGLSYPF